MIVDISLEQTNYKMYLPNFNEDMIQSIFLTQSFLTNKVCLNIY